MFNYPLYAQLYTTGLVTGGPTTLGFQVRDSAGVLVVAFTSTGVRETSVAGNYTAGVVSLPDTAALIEWGPASGGAMGTVLADEAVAAPDYATVADAEAIIAAIESIPAPTDPLTNSPDDYANNTIGDLIGRLDTPTHDPYVIVVPSASGADQMACYTVTRDAQGALEGRVRVDFEIVSLPDSADGVSYATTATGVSNALTADEPALLVINLMQGATYKAKRQDGDDWVTFTVPTTGTSFALPQTVAERPSLASVI